MIAKAKWCESQGALEYLLTQLLKQMIRSELCTNTVNIVKQLLLLKKIGTIAKLHLNSKADPNAKPNPILNHNPNHNCKPSQYGIGQNIIR